MRLVVVALFSVLVVGLIGAAAYQQSFLTSVPTAPAQQRWLEQKLVAIKPSAGSSPTIPPSSAATDSSATALGTVVGGLVGFAIRRGPVSIAAGALIGYIAATGVFSPLFSAPPPKPEPTLWQKLRFPSGS